jgi:aspartate beta-hydroxylase
MTGADPHPSSEPEIRGILHASRDAVAKGRLEEADQLLVRAAQMAPHHPAVLNELGVRMLQRGEADSARTLFERATAGDGRHPALWSNLAASLHALRRYDDELEAIEKALAIDPRHLSSLLQKATLIEERGDVRNAARAFRNALATLPQGFEAPASVRQSLEHARAAVARDDASLTEALAQRLQSIRDQHAGATFRRVDKCLDLLTGKRERFFPSPTFMLFPELPSIEFFDRGDFPWLDAIEHQADEMRAELARVLVADRGGLQPYIAYPDGVPLDQWRDLNKSRRWSAYFLWNQGEAQRDHVAKCPVTAQAVQRAPLCDVAARGPTAFFSVLDAGTRIPPHTGVTNTRLIVHLPLIVPPGCGFRVGGETREWVPGQAWVFDDTIEHEAWNNSDTPRAILIFDIWNPLLSAAERDLARAATEVVGAYYGGNSREAI